MQVTSPSRHSIKPADLYGARTYPGVNWCKVMAVSAIGLTLVTPVVAVAAAGRIPLSERKFGDSGSPAPSCNGSSCTAPPPPPPANLTGVALDYLKKGQIPTSFKISAGPLDQIENPVERAMALHQKRSALAQEVQTPEIREQKYQLLVSEIWACQDVADQTEDPQTQMEWLQRAMVEYNVPKKDVLYEIPCLNYGGAQEECLVNTAALWKQAADTFAKLSRREALEWKSVLPDVHGEGLATPLYCSSRCLEYAAHYSVKTNPSKAMTYYEDSFRLKKELDLSKWPFEDRAKLQVEIADMCGAAYRLGLKESIPSPFLASRVSQEYYKAFELYNQSDRPYHQVEAGWQVWDAARYEDVSAKKIELLKLGVRLMQAFVKKYDTKETRLILADTNFARAHRDNVRTYTLLECFEIRLAAEQSWRIKRYILSWWYS